MSEAESAVASNRCFAIVSGKGGTGKSIITATIAALLTECGFRVLLLDTDVFTAGLSFYLLGSNPRQARIGLQDVLLKGVEWQQLRPLETQHQGISIVPAISRNRVDASELRISASFDFKTLVQQLRELRDQWLGEFDYVIFDTRGGMDHTSVAACVAAGAYIVVTEADKTSWDLGENLTQSIEDAALSLDEEVVPFGFILNKNVLPSEAIETFLRRRWSMPHLATIPFDEAAIRAFQNDEIPDVDPPRGRLAAGLTFVLQKGIVDDDWSPAARHHLVALLDAAMQVQAREARPGHLSKLDVRLFLLRAYSLMIVFGMAAAGTYLYVNPTSTSQSERYLWLLLLGSALFYVFGLMIDRRFSAGLAWIMRRLRL